MDSWTELLDSGRPLDVVYLNFSKAFDSVPHQGLLKKLQAYGIQGKLLKWVEAFFTSRWQRVVGGDKSQWHQVTSGVPQEVFLAHYYS